MTVFARLALLPDGWARNQRVLLAGQTIAQITPAEKPAPDDRVVDVLLPGLPNLHSHAFQRGFSGLTEHRGPQADSFWTWREIMYRFAHRMSPDAMEAIAALAYAEMLESGFTRVGEFHYLHHAPDGRPYDAPAELSARIFAAAHETGLHLTHLPVFYAHGGFGPQPATAGQARFVQDLGSFARIVQDCAAWAGPHDRIGLAPHSLRAASMADIRSLAEAFATGPLHLHIAEQEREVHDCLTFCGQRPVEYLLAEAPVDARWCLIHATHLTEAEVQGIARSGAVVGLCPITEANLGDGVFPAEAFLAAGGRFGLGTDSNVDISAAGELRLLEYGQRLTRRARNVCATVGSTGGRLFRDALSGGAQALAAEAPALRRGALADLVALRDPMQLDMADDSVLDRWIFGRDLQVDHVWVAARHVVRDGAHIDKAGITERARRACRAILETGSAQIAVGPQPRRLT